MTAAIISVPQFRANFPEFSSTATYPTSQVQFYLDLAYSMLNASRWGRQLPFGIQLYTAHNISMEAQMMSQVQAGGIAGANGGGLGVVTAKSVDKVSVSLDASSAQDKLAGDYNLTLYGVRLWKLIKLFGAGPLTSVNPGPAQGGGANFAANGAWSGPDVMPGFTNFGT